MGRKALIHAENFVINNRAQAMSYRYLLNDISITEAIEHIKNAYREPEDLLPDFIKAHFADNHMIDLTSITNTAEYRQLFNRIVNIAYEVFIIYAIKYYREEMVNMFYVYELPAGSNVVTKLKDEDQDLDYARADFLYRLTNQNVLFTDMIRRIMRYICPILNIVAERELMKSAHAKESEIPNYKIQIKLIDGEKDAVNIDLSSQSSMEEIANALNLLPMIEGIVFNKSKLERVAINDIDTSILLTVDVSKEHKYRIWKLHDDDTTLVLTD